MLKIDERTVQSDAGGREGGVFVRAAATTTTAVDLTWKLIGAALAPQDPLLGRLNFGDTSSESARPTNERDNSA